MVRMDKSGNFNIGDGVGGGVSITTVIKEYLFCWRCQLLAVSSFNHIIYKTLLPLEEITQFRYREKAPVTSHS